MITVNDLLNLDSASLVPRNPPCPPEPWEALIMEYLVAMTTRVPDGTPEQAVSDVRAREAALHRP